MGGDTLFQCTFPSCQQQTGAVDCGLFAIARLFEYATGNYDLENVVFEQSGMRMHFVNCVKRNQLTPFPKLTNPTGIAMSNTTTHTFPVICICKLPHFWGPTIQCTNCTRYYHRECVGLTHVETTYVCQNCTQ